MKLTHAALTAASLLASPLPSSLPNCSGDLNSVSAGENALLTVETGINQFSIVGSPTSSVITASAAECVQISNKIKALVGEAEKCPNISLLPAIENSHTLPGTPSLSIPNLEPVVASLVEKQEEKGILNTLNDILKLLRNIFSINIAPWILGPLIGWLLSRRSTDKHTTQHLQISRHMIQNGKFIIIKEDAPLSHWWTDKREEKLIAGLVEAHSKKMRKKQHDPQIPFVDIPPHLRGRVERALKRVISKQFGLSLNSTLHSQNLKQKRLIIALTMEDYGIGRNELPRIIVVDQETEVKHLDPAEIQLIEDSKSENPRWCFSVEIIIAAKKDPLL